jgi:hypothetical protein
MAKMILNILLKLGIAIVLSIYTGDDEVFRELPKINYPLFGLDRLILLSLLPSPLPERAIGYFLFGSLLAIAIC